ncbi:MAG: hypothetical protein IJJ69_00565 [Oscillospiraceae bacterium]|nr:hypothetical protein [Oscillospiraceae bacterium]
MNWYNVVYEQQLPGGVWQRVNTQQCGNSESEVRQYIISHNVNPVRIISITRR